MLPAQPTVPCDICGVHVRPSSIGNHKRDYHQKTVKINVSGEQTIVVHRISGLFHCPCCESYSTELTRTFRSHVLDCVQHDARNDNSTTSVADENTESGDRAKMSSQITGIRIISWNTKYKNPLTLL